MSAVQSVERALDLLTAVASEPAGLVDLAKRTGLPVTTASRLLATLESRKAVTRLAGGSYEIGPLIAGLGSGAVATPDLQSLARLHMAQLSDHVDEAVALSIPLAEDSLTIFQLDAPKPVQAQDWTGARWPLTAGDLGLVLIATWPQSRVDDILAQPLRSCTTRTCTDRDEIRARLDTITESGLCWTTGEYVEGLTSVSAAVVDPDGRAIASLQIYGPSYRFGSKSGRGPIDRELLRAARRISQEVQEARY
jgi:IclR family transcriptional regulator, KDG regulon repressor